MHAGVNPALFPLLTVRIHIQTGSALSLFAPVFDRPFTFLCVKTKSSGTDVYLIYLIYELMLGVAGHQLVLAAQH